MLFRPFLLRNRRVLLQRLWVSPEAEEMMDVGSIIRLSDSRLNAPTDIPEPPSILPQGGRTSQCAAGRRPFDTLLALVIGWS
jgi:hypothetical protein